MPSLQMDWAHLYSTMTSMGHYVWLGIFPEAGCNWTANLSLCKTFKKEYTTELYKGTRIVMPMSQIKTKNCTVV